MSLLTGTNSSAKPDNTVRSLYKVCVDCVKRLDQTTKDKHIVSSLFLPDIVAVREKLRDASERLIFHNPLDYGRKAEDLIWKKCFYEPMQLLRTNKESLTQKQRCWTNLLLYSASGYFHGYLFRLQQNFNLKNDIIEFGLHTGLDQTSTKSSVDRNNWAISSICKTLIYLGDLARYGLDFTDDSVRWFQLAKHYYLQAAATKPNYGMPFNQLGTLFGSVNCGLDGTFYYLRCIDSEESFEGAVGNVTLVLKCATAQCHSLEQGNDGLIAHSVQREDHIRRLYLTFLNVVHVLFEDSPDADAQVLIQNSIGCLETSLSHIENTNEDTPELNFSCQTLAKMFVTLMIIKKRLQDSNSAKADLVTSFLITSFVIVVEFCLKTLRKEVKESKIQEEQVNNNGLINTSIEQEESVENLSEECKPTKNTNQRPLIVRRRTCGSDSEAEDKESQDSQDQDIVVLSSSSDEEEEINDVIKSVIEEKKTNTEEITVESSAAAFMVLKDEQKLDRLKNCDILMVIKVLCDWLRCNPNLVASMTAEYNHLLIALSNLLNILPHEKNFGKAGDIMIPSSLKEWIQENPLPEDLAFKGIHSLNQVHSGLNFSKRHMDIGEETLIRLCSIRSFGHYLIRLNVPGFQYDSVNSKFIAPEPTRRTFGERNGLNNNGTHSSPVLPRAQLMERMGKLRLNDELRQMAQVGWIPVYLVPDTVAMVNRLPLVKQLVGCQRFVIVIPQAVLRELDKMKKESSNAREAIRWLEICVQQGSKYLRPQKNAEKEEISATEQMTSETSELMSLCANLSRTVTSTNEGTTVVTLITNHNYDSLPFNAFTDAIQKLQLIGVSVDNVQRFVTRWQSHRKKAG